MTARAGDDGTRRTIRAPRRMPVGLLEELPWARRSGCTCYPSGSECSRHSGWSRFGIAMAILIALALIAHLAGGNLRGFFGKLHGQ